MYFSDRRPFPSAAPVRSAVPILAFVLGIVGLTQLAPVWGPVHSLEPAFGSVALAAAGVPGRIPIGYVGIGIVRLYLTALPLALLASGAVAAATKSRIGVAVGTLLGLGAAGTLTGLSGCRCGVGSSAFLVEWALVAA
jgi:hypothetical protein